MTYRDEDKYLIMQGSPVKISIRLCQTGTVSRRKAFSYAIQEQSHEDKHLIMPYRDSLTKITLRQTETVSPREFDFAIKGQSHGNKRFIFRLNELLLIDL
jgi:hypothetical protein